MMIHRAWSDKKGTSAIEFALTAPVFFLLLFVIIEGGLLLWTQLGLQHGVELAARCATVNSTLCGNTSAIQNYAAQQAFGLNVPSSTFVVSTTSSCGNKVSASYTYQFITSVFGLPSLTLSALSCFPK
jgi:Flp pilus assembly protein TadG